MRSLTPLSRPNCDWGLVNILDAVFAWGERNGSVKSNPCRGVEKFKLETRERVFSGDDEWKTLGQKLASEASDERGGPGPFPCP